MNMNLENLTQFIDEALKTIKIAEDNIQHTKNNIETISADVWDNEIVPTLKPYSLLLKKLVPSGAEKILASIGINYFNKSSYINPGATYNYLTSNNILYLGGMPCRLVPYCCLDRLSAEKSSVDYLVTMWNEVKPKMIASIEEDILKKLKNKCEVVNKQNAMIQAELQKLQK